MENGVTNAIIGTNGIGAKAFDGLSRLTDGIRKGIDAASSSVSGLLDPLNPLAFPAVLGGILPGLP